MPRTKPHVCHKCGQAYTGWRCPDCYKRKKSGRGSGGQGGRRGSRLRLQSILSSDVLPVYPEAAACAVSETPAPPYESQSDGASRSQNTIDDEKST